MHADEAIRAVETGQIVTANYAAGEEIPHARGRVIGYCDAPQVLIQTESGERIWWRADLCRADSAQAATFPDIYDLDTRPGYPPFVLKGGAETI